MGGAGKELRKVEVKGEEMEGGVNREIRDAVLLSFAAGDKGLGRQARDSMVGKLDVLSKRIAKAPSKYDQGEVAKAYRDAVGGGGFNNPQLTAIAAALTRRITNIVGPPGTGKTTTGAAIAKGAVSLQRSHDPSGHSKVLCCAFSNVGADNFAEKVIVEGLKVVRVGRSSAMSEGLVEHSLDWYIDQDEGAQSALKLAAEMTSRLKSKDRNRERSARSEATDAVKKSIAACQKAAYEAIRGCDVVVSTCVGAFDPRLMACLGKGGDEQEDGGWTPPVNIKLDFVVVDEACQSVEPATLIPVVGTGCEVRWSEEGRQRVE